VRLTTAEEALDGSQRDKVVRMFEGSWGECGDHRVWLNDGNRWMWDVEYRAEGTFLKALHELPWRTMPQVRGMLEHAGRQLLLMQASDWPFSVHTGTATDYGIERFAGHSTNFHRVLEMAHDLAGDARGTELGELQKADLVSMELHDSVFDNIDLNWWMRNGH
jgi:1,4-alpha-glucan branching enzyme